MRLWLTILAACGLVLLVAAGCSGDDSPEAATTDTATAATPPPPPVATTTTEPPAAAAAAGSPDPEPGLVLLRFVKAAGRNDAKAMWNLLSEPTKASVGPTLEDFRAGAGQEFARGLGSLAPSAKVIFSRKLDEDWSAAAVSGVRTEGDTEERYSYGAALLPEDGKLKLELGGVVVKGWRPEPTEEITDTTPVVGANVGAGGDLTDLRLWLDGKPLPFARGANDTPFTATLRGEPSQPLAKGEHEALVFAATDVTATASAWGFTVK